ncbi:acyltransferase [Mycolicibacterium sp.]|uniref:acyltransferase n=1 Tax=Mycolicibacterium sp. TaxID=2320850 RepID=UPI0025D7AC8E|nr:acyltransferase [Mycolicibacterium sp.]
MSAQDDGALSERQNAPRLKVPPPPLLVKGPDDRVIEYKMQNMGLARKARNRIGALLYSSFVTHIPSHTIRQAFLRLFGATIGKDSAIMRGTLITDIEFLSIGDNTAIGGRCFLDCRAGIAIGDNVTIASDTQFICGGHEINHPDFLPTISPTVVEDYVWIASRSMVLPCHIGRGAVVAAQSLVNKDVAALDVVGGVPAKVISQRKPEGLGYSGKYRPLFS